MKPKTVKSLVKITGEELEFDITSPEDAIKVWKIASEYIKAYEAIKDKIKKLVPTFVNTNGTYENNGFQFRYSIIQRQNYDKSALRNLVDDQDLYDDLMIPNKTMIDRLLREQDDRLWPISHELRESMVSQGNPYTVVKLEKLTNGLENP